MAALVRPALAGTDQSDLMTCIRQRAKSPEQKALRRQQILDAAAGYFAEAPFEQVSLHDIAQRVGITKAALYRYFRNKEALFLALYHQQLERLVGHGEQLNIDGDAAIVCAQALAEEPLFCRLNAILHTVLERNLTEEEARNFKLGLLPLLQRFAMLISRWLSISAAEAVELLLHIQQAMIGCWHICYPSKTVAAAIAEPPLTLFRLEFSTTLQQHLSWLFAGYKASHIHRTASNALNSGTAHNSPDSTAEIQ
jgi:AcrR family transcriptional regulator